jgi:hypothetical protein
LCGALIDIKGSVASMKAAFAMTRKSFALPPVIAVRYFWRGQVLAGLCTF